MPNKYNELGHPETIPLHLPVCEKTVFHETSSWCQRLGTVVLNESSYVFLNWPQHLPPPQSFPSLFNGIPSIKLLKIRNWVIIGHFCLILSFQSKISPILSLHVSSILFLHCNVIITNLVQAQITLKLNYWSAFVMKTYHVPHASDCHSGYYLSPYL